MNLAHPENLEALRGERDKLGTQLARHRFARAILFTLFVFTLASAFQTISSQDASGIVRQIKELKKISGLTPILDDFLTAIYFPSDGDVRTEGSDSGVTAEAKHSEAEIEQAKKDQVELGRQLTAITKKAFTFSFRAPLLGNQLDLDLHIWCFILPLFFILWEVYLSVQQHKLRTLQRIGGTIVERVSWQATVVDHLIFGSNDRRIPAFIRHPAQFEWVLSWIGGLLLTGYLCFEGYDFWIGTARVAKHVFVELYAFAIIYAISYASYSKRQINTAAISIESFEAVNSYPIPRLLAFAGLRFGRYARRLWPEVNLLTGSVMVIGTVGLLVGAPFGCNPRTGWQYLHDPGGWLVGPACGEGAVDLWHNRLIAAFYGVGLAMAGFTFVLVLFSLTMRKRLGRGRISPCMAAGTTALALFFLTELTFGQLLDYLPYLLPCVLLWLVPMWKWGRYAYAKRPDVHAHWPRVRRSLMHWYAPQVAVATVISVGTLFDAHPLVGVPVFVGGMALLALGYGKAVALAGNGAVTPENVVLPGAQTRAGPTAETIR